MATKEQNQTVRNLIYRRDTLKTNKHGWESQWAEIADYMLPRYAGNFTNTSSSRGIKKKNLSFDSTASRAVERFAALLDSILTPVGQKWHTLSTGDATLDSDPEVREWLYTTNNILFKQRYAANSNFQSQNFERWLTMGAFGTSSLYVDYHKGLRYKMIHLKNLNLDVNHQGIVDTIYRDFELSAIQAVDRFGRKNLPEKITKAFDSDNSKNDMFTFVHIVAPNLKPENNKIDYRSSPFLCYYVELESKTLVEDVKGYETMPYSTSRYALGADEVFGSSIAMSCIADVKMLSEMSKVDIKATHKLVDPPLAVHDDGIFGGGLNINLTPGAINPGGVNKDGRLLVQPIISGARVDISETKMEQRRKSIEDSFMLNLFQILVESPRMTATEALIRSQEKGMLLNPAMGRQQSETLGVQIERELSLLQAHDKLPPMPQVMIDRGGEYEISYTSPLNRMQRSEELIGAQRMIEQLTPLSQIDKNVMDIININKLAQLFGELSGIPPTTMNSEDEIQAIREERKEQEQGEQLTADASVMGGVIKDLASASKSTQGIR